jgi:hypothetical protein
MCKLSLQPNAKKESSSIDIIDLSEAFPSHHLLGMSASLTTNSKNLSQESQVIELIDDSDDEEFEPMPSKRQKLESNNSANSTTKITKIPPLLSFSVSKNSGRIAIHEAVNGDSLSINFDVEKIVNADMSEELLMRQLKRSGTHLSVSASQVTFQDSEVEKGKATQVYQSKFESEGFD